MIGSQFRCNLCGSPARFEPEGDWRESPTCQTCGSSVRARQVVHCLTRGLSGRSEVLDDLEASSVKGLGLSDWTGLASRLEKKFSYTNSFYHQEPKLDICNPDSHWVGSVEFLISSDVFEHVPSPVQMAFDGAAKVLAPGGLLVLTVPFAEGQQTIEHYPDLRAFGAFKLDEEWLVVGQTSDGSFAAYRNPIFHGGPGTTVEMRFFGFDHLVELLTQSGFTDIRLHDEEVPEWGIFLPHRFGLPITARHGS